MAVASFRMRPRGHRAEGAFCSEKRGAAGGGDPCKGMSSRIVVYRVAEAVAEAEKLWRVQTSWHRTHRDLNTSGPLVRRGDRTGRIWERASFPSASTLALASDGHVKSPTNGANQWW
jgi:hypothetical protein